MMKKSTVQKLTTIATAILDHSSSISEVGVAVSKANAMLSSVQVVSTLEVLEAYDAVLLRKSAWTKQRPRTATNQGAYYGY